MNANQILNFAGKWVAVGFCGFFGWKLAQIVFDMILQRAG